MTSRDLKIEAAEAILTAIKKQAESAEVPGRILELAEAYAAVTGAAPRQSTGPRSVVTG